MGRRAHMDGKANGRSRAAGRSRRFTTGIEMLEQRAVLSGISPAVLPPPPIDGSEVVAPPTPVVAGLRVLLPSVVPNGVPTVASVVAIDAAGRPAFGWSGSVKLTSSDAAATLPATATLVNGRAMVPVTFRTAGPQTVSVTDAVVPTLVGTVSTTVAQPRVAAKISLVMPAQTRAGMPTNVLAIAVDAAGRPVPTFSGTATVGSSDAAAGLPLVPVAFKDGRASFAVSFATAGRQTVTVKSLDDAGVTGTAATAVTAAQTLASFLILMPPRSAAGVAVSATILAVDAGKRPIPNYSGTATLTSSDPAATLPQTVTFSGGRAVARVTFATVGSQTLTVRGGAAGDVTAVASTLVATTPVATRFAVMIPRGTASGRPVAMTIVAIDAQGRPVPTYTGTATLASSDPAALLPATVTFVNGRALARVTFATLGQQTLTVTAGAISGTATINVGEIAIWPVIDGGPIVLK